MSNIGFRLLAVPGADGLTSLGHTPGMLYTCPATGPKNDTTCAPDGLATTVDPVLAQVEPPGTIRVGDHTRSQVAYLRIGPVGMMWLPAEAGPESTIGMPAGYLDSPENWHAEDPSLHAFGADYVTSGYVKNRMADRVSMDRRSRERRTRLRRPALGLPDLVRRRRVRRTRHVCRAVRGRGDRVPRCRRRRDVQGRHGGPVVARRLRARGRGGRRQLPVRSGVRRGRRTTTGRPTPSVGTSKPTSSPRSPDSPARATPP